MATEDTLPFKSRTQIREFSTVAIYGQYTKGAYKDIFYQNVHVKALPGHQKKKLFTDLGLPSECNMEVLVLHNVRLYIHKDNVSFDVHKDPHGTEMITMSIHGVVQGYVEPLN